MLVALVAAPMAVSRYANPCRYCRHRTDWRGNAPEVHCTQHAAEPVNHCTRFEADLGGAVDRYAALRVASARREAMAMADRDTGDTVTA